MRKGCAQAEQRRVHACLGWDGRYHNRCWLTGVPWNRPRPIHSGLAVSYTAFVQEAVDVLDDVAVVDDMHVFALAGFITTSRT